MTFTARRFGAALIVGALALAACGSDSADSDSAEDAAATTTAAETTTTETPAETTTTTEPVEESAYPVELETASGPLTIAAQPERIVSLSASTTEMLFAIGAGDQVVAVDNTSSFPAEAPVTDLSAFDPNFEAIAAFEPDLVIASFDPENALATAFAAIDVPFLVQGTAVTVEDTYAQIADLGVITGQIDEAAAVNADIRSRIEAAVASIDTTADPVRVYHELDDTFFSVSSASFIGDIYNQLGFVNVADEADPDGFGFPQLTPEYIIEADPNLIVITDQVGYTTDDVAARPGWDVISAVQDGNIEQIDADIASRWGPRVADLVETIAALSNRVTAS